MEKVVFTNGCFDVLHPGHLDLLERARALGTKLIVGINSDDSVRQIKGVQRPIMSENDRATLLKGLRSVSEVLIFRENTPENIIRKIKPQVLVKGGDWKLSEIIGADFVLQNGGEVYSLPLQEGYSSTNIIEKFQKSVINKSKGKSTGGVFENSLKEHQTVIESLLTTQINNIKVCGELIFKTLEAGKKLFFCGNGGSAADAQHLAAEFVGRYERERRAFPAIALTTDTSALTALSNDYSFEKIFSRQIEALAAEGDLLVAISTSGNSTNVIAAVMSARLKGCQTICLTGLKGKKLASLCDASVLVPSARTSRIQEAHITIGHLWCEFVDLKF